LAVRNWNRGESSIAAMEMLTRGLGRLGSDLDLALPMRPPGTDTPNLLFRGDPDRIQFVAATGFGAGDRGLELISVSVIKEEDGIALVRERAPVSTVATSFRDPVILLRGRLQVQFAYRDSDGQTLPTWWDRPQLPRSVGVYVYGATGLPVFPVPVQLNVPTNLAAGCLTGDDDSGGCPQDQQQQQRRQQQQQQQQDAADAANRN
jgi:hypothetical protein